ncbi:MAG: homoserine O-acetyltransferase [Armatimonadota bacterium]
MTKREPGSVGIVETKLFTFGVPPDELELECGLKLGPIDIAYEMYGEMNGDKSNCILVTHALSGDAHAAGRHSADDPKPGWWDSMIGPEKAFDTNKYCVICTNVIGGCSRSTGPASINPKTGKPYGLDFPMVTISDMVNAQKRLIDSFGIKELACVVGGSMGGMQALQWAVSYPDMMRLAIPIASTARLSAQQIGFDAIGRHAIMADPDWNNGNYYGSPEPDRGLAIARMIGHIQYMSEKSMHQKYGRGLQDKEKPDYDFVTEFQVESYLDYKGGEFVKRFDANSYLYITKATDYFDLAQPSGDLRRELSRVKAAVLVVSFSSDWLFPSYMSKELVSALRKNNVDVSYAEVQSDYGHDAFLLEADTLGRLVANFLEYADPKRRPIDG